MKVGQASLLKRVAFTAKMLVFMGAGPAYESIGIQDEFIFYKAIQRRIYRHVAMPVDI